MVTTIIIRTITTPIRAVEEPPALLSSFSSTWGSASGVSVTASTAVLTASVDVIACVEGISSVSASVLVLTVVGVVGGVGGVGDVGDVGGVGGVGDVGGVGGVVELCTVSCSSAICIRPAPRDLQVTYSSNSHFHIPVSPS